MREDSDVKEISKQEQGRKKAQKRQHTEKKKTLIELYLMTSEREDKLLLKQVQDTIEGGNRTGSILGQTVDFELYAQDLCKQQTNWKTRPPGWKSPRAHT